MIAFDLDGTLVDSASEIRAVMAAAWSQVLPELAFDPRSLRIGPPLGLLVAELTPLVAEARRVELIATFRARYDASDFSATRPYPGIPQLLADLVASGETLAIATNKRLAPSLLITERWFPGVFAAVCAIDGPVPGDKPSMLRGLAAQFPSAARVMVGDTAADIEAARAASFRAIGVRWGYGDEALAAAGADVLVHDAEGLRAALFPRA